MGPVRRAPRRAVAGLIRGYQMAFSWRSSSCRFYPTCSEYGRQSVLRYGLLRGAWLGVRRIARCHPWNPGGVDPVPEHLNDAHDGRGHSVRAAPRSLNGRLG